MVGAGRTICIAGAGIAGLTLALALAKFGANVIVLERNDGPSEIGAGLQISPNARRVLDRLGLGEAIAERGLEPTGIDVYPFGRTKPLVTLELGNAARDRFASPYAVMHRADLAELLHKACKRFANIDIVHGVPEFSAASDGNGVTVVCEALTRRGRSGRAFALVGADGVHSPTRARLLDGPPAQYAGRLAWRTLIPIEKAKGLLVLDRTSLFLSPGVHLVAYPLPHRGVINVVMFSKAAAQAEHSSRLGVPDSALSERMRALVAAAGGWTAWPLYTVETSQWCRGNIGLVGDAAHAMLPFQAQGAAMAIEDAATLAPLLMEAPDAETAFARYETLRRRRVERVARLSRANGRIFHMRWPLTMGRDLVMRVGGRHSHFRRLAWLYGFDPTPGAS
jgi:salicylate hydroxylase